MAPFDPSLVGDEAHAQGEHVEHTAVTGAVLGAEGKGCHPSLEVSGGKDGDLLQHPFVHVEAKRPTPLVPRLEALETAEVEFTRACDVEEAGASTVTRGASWVFGPTVSSVVSLV